ncbi:MAG: hypothetical protein MJ239_01965 [Bacilli bacterium]|nr:hypothetical protein [Bacilli bacterium]
MEKCKRFALIGLGIGILSAASFGVSPIEVSAAIPDDRTLAAPYDPTIPTLGDYSVNTYITSLEQLQSYAEENAARPTNAILYINEAGAVTDSKGNSLGISYKLAYSAYLKNAIIPCFYIKDAGTLDAFSTYWLDEWKHWDCSLVSDDPSLLLSARQKLPILRGILDYSKKTFTAADYGSMVKETHLSMANTLIFNDEQATYDTVRYFQARFKTVWVDTSNSSNIDTAKQVCQGAYGVIVKNAEESYNYLKAFSNSAYPKSNYNRIAYNVAHRGLPQTNYENSLEGCIEAYEKGATHIEVDIQVTKDNKLAIMHDDTIDRTTTGTGKISDYTAEELKAFRIDSTLSVQLKGEGVPIPMLDQIFSEFKGKDLVIIVEIKTAATNAVSLLKQYIEEADIADQVVVISFYPAQLVKMKEELPYIPCADLNSYNQGAIEGTSFKTINTNNYVIDTNGAGYTSLFLKTLAHRGYASWLWTYENVSNVYTAIKNGIVGITNNVADSAGQCPTGIVVPSEIETESLEKCTVEATVTTYTGELNEKIEATPLFLEKLEDGSYTAIFSGKFDTGTKSPRLQVCLFSAPAHVVIKQKDNPPVNPDGKNSTTLLVVGGISLGVIALGTATFFLLRRRFKK